MSTDIPDFGTTAKAGGEDIESHLKEDWLVYKVVDRGNIKQNRLQADKTYKEEMRWDGMAFTVVCGHTSKGKDDRTVIYTRSEVIRDNIFTRNAIIAECVRQQRPFKFRVRKKNNYFEPDY